MPTLTQKLSHAANVATWKVNQQLRLTNVNSQIGTLEGQIRAEKLRLADVVLSLVKINELGFDKIQEIVANIDKLTSEWEAKKREMEGIRNEAPPLPSSQSEAMPVLEGVVTDVSKSPSGQLICPNCHSVVPVRFCENCGTQGVPSV